MGKLLNRLNKQISNTDYSDNAKDCIEMYNWIKSIDKDGKVWASDWNPLVSVEFKGKERLYKPTTIGKTLLKGIKQTNK